MRITLFERVIPLCLIVSCSFLTEGSDCDSLFSALTETNGPKKTTWASSIQQERNISLWFRSDTNGCCKGVWNQQALYRRIVECDELYTIRAL